MIRRTAEGKVSRQTSDVVDGATSDDQTHGRDGIARVRSLTVMPAEHPYRRRMNPLSATPCIAVLMLVAVASPAPATQSRPVGARLSGGSVLPAGCADGVPPDMFAATPALERETSTTVDPKSDQTRAVAWLQDDARAVVVARTVDGGKRWSSAVVPGIGACAGGPTHQRYLFHPRLGFGPDGRLWLAVMTSRGAGTDPRNLFSEVLVTTSTGRPGAPWSATAQLAELGTLLGDIDTMSVQQDKPATAYVAHDTDTFAPGQRVAVSRSTDGGRSWTRHDVATLAPGDVSFGRVLAVAGETVLLATTQTRAAVFAGVDVASNLVIYRSTDGGRTWSTTPTATGVRHAEWPGLVRSGDGTVHLVWRETTAAGSYFVKVRSSRDDGATWGEAITAGTGTTTAVNTADLGAAAGPQRQVGVLLTDSAESTTTVRALVSPDGRTWRSSTIAADVDLSAVPDGDPGRITDAAGTREGLVAAVPLGGAAWSPTGPTDVFAVSAPWKPARRH